MILQIYQKSANTKIYFLNLIIYTHKNFHAQLSSNVHTQTPKHSTGVRIIWGILGILVYVIIYIVTASRGLQCSYILSITVSVQQFIRYSLKLFQVITLLPFFEGVFKHGVLFLGSFICFIYLIYLYFDFFYYFMYDCVLKTLKKIKKCLRKLLQHVKFYRIQPDLKFRLSLSMGVLYLLYYKHSKYTINTLQRLAVPKQLKTLNCILQYYLNKSYIVVVYCI